MWRKDKRRTSRASANLKIGTLDLILREMLEVRVCAAIHNEYYPHLLLLAMGGESAAHRQREKDVICEAQNV